MTASAITLRHVPRLGRADVPACHPAFATTAPSFLDHRKHTFHPNLMILVSEFCRMKDGQNSVRKLLDTTGTVVANYDYDAFGNVLHQDQPSGWIFAHRAFGEVQDPNLGMIYLRARWMDPGTGGLRVGIDWGVGV